MDSITSEKKSDMCHFQPSLLLLATWMSHLLPNTDGMHPLVRSTAHDGVQGRPLVGREGVPMTRFEAVFIPCGDTGEVHATPLHRA